MSKLWTNTHFIFQLQSRLVTTIFSRYDKHRRLLLDDILASIARLPSSKRGLRTFRLSADQHIQMLTALVLQLIQCVLCLPEKLGAPTGTTNSGEEVESSISVGISFSLDTMNDWILIKISIFSLCRRWIRRYWWLRGMTLRSELLPIFCQSSSASVE